MGHSLTARLTAGSIRKLFDSLVEHAAQLNDKEKKIVKVMLADFEELTTKRNDIVHSMWFVGWGDENTTDFSVVEGMKSGHATFKQLEIEVGNLRKLSEQAEALGSLFQRLYACFVGRHSVEKNFVLSPDEKQVSVVLA